MAIRVLLAEGQTGTRSALRLLLEQEQEVAVVGETRWAGDLVAQALAVEPDMLLLDWGLPGMRGPGVLMDLRRQFPRLMVIALSARPEAGRDALAAGVDAFVSKGEPPERLLETIHRVVGVLSDSST